jgi:hypothetical protein
MRRIVATPSSIHHGSGPGPEPIYLDHRRVELYLLNPADLVQIEETEINGNHQYWH